MKVRLCMAISPNGYIARNDGREDWLSSKNWDEMFKQVAECKNLVIGRKTHELVKELYTDYNFNNIAAADKIIVTRSADYQGSEDYTIVQSPGAAVKFLQSKGVDTLLLTGGGELNAEFLKSKLVDELVLIIDPYVIGEGRQVFNPGGYELALELSNLRELEDGRVKLTYNVKRYVES